MPTPEYVLRLREKIGHDPLVLIGVTAVILREDTVLLGRRTDTGRLTPITGIVDPGEEPATAARREAAEEAGIDIVVERLARVTQTGRTTHVNGDLVDYLDLTFRCRWVGGEPRPVDGEMRDLAWFPLDALDGVLGDEHRARVLAASTEHGEAIFRTG